MKCAYFIAFCYFFYHSMGDRTNLKIYTSLMANNFCFRRLNATQQTGCSSGMSGDVGIVYVVDTLEDLNWVTRTGPDAPYVAILSQEFFNFGNMTEIKESNRVSGVLVLQEDSTDPFAGGFSPDDACPNANFGLYAEERYPKYASCAKGNWNPRNPGLGMAFEDWGMPIFLITNSSDILSIRRDCFEKFNKPLPDGSLRPWPLCACQLFSAMHAAKDSPTCMRRSSMIPSLTHTTPLKLCDPLSSKNVIATLYPTNSSRGLENRSVVVVAARLDSFSMFDGISPGADSSVTGFVTLLSVANTLTKAKEEMKDVKKNVLFAFFNGEAFGYIGSSRAVFDMLRGEFPQALNSRYAQPALMNLSHVSHFLEVSQLASPNIWIHTDPVTANRTGSEVKKMIGWIREYGGPNVRVSSRERPLPPASLQSFLRQDTDIPGVVVASFNESFENKFYNSRFDTLSHMGTRTELAQHLTNISNIISATVFSLVTDRKAPSSLAVDVKLMDQMLECYLENSTCSLFQEIGDPTKATSAARKSDPLPTYVSVLNPSYLNALAQYTRYLLAYLTGEHMDGYVSTNCTGDDNDRIFSYSFMAGRNDSNVCVKSTVAYTLALSPADELDDWTTTEYSTWTESVWQMTSVTIFLHPSRAQEGLVLGIGILMVVVSFLLVYYVNKRASVLFGTRGLVGC